MADSIITKRAFASALKELTKELPYNKITVGKICDKCDMNRTSFYYHFRDKYDLVNWIFDTEFVDRYQPITTWDDLTEWESIRAMISYFYENRDFYRKILEFHGQNSFIDHFRAILYPIFYEDLKGILNNDDKMIDFQVNFFADAFISAIERWICSKDCPPPDECVELLKSCLNTMVDRGSKLQEQTQG